MNPLRKVNAKALNMYGKLYLIPNTLGGENASSVLPSGVINIMNQLSHFIVENERTARRFLISCGYDRPIDDIRFYLLNKHTDPSDIPEFLDPCRAEIDMGIISEAGAPGVADPGAEVVNIAHKNNIEVVPLTGPSSVLLALMASGLNGQQFSFHGYLPVKPHERKNQIKKLEAETRNTGFCQIFIETPYRNKTLFKALIETCRDDTRLCIACDLTMKTEFIKTLSIAAWKKERVDLHKRPCIFLLN